MNIEGIYTEEDLEDNEELEKLNCPFCIKVGLHIPLGPKILMPNEVKQPDYENWLQCSRCAEIIPIYQAEKEESIKDEVTTIQNPFEESKGEVLGAHRKGKRKNRKDTDLDWIHDEDLKRKLKHGSTLLSYSEEMP